MVLCKQGFIITIALILFIDKIMFIISVRYLQGNMKQIINFMSMINISLLILSTWLLNLGMGTC